ncbi:ABC transporter substrate-binding protein [Halomonas sp. NyZ770]|uniref:CmpA/NrtA family ABC transporter substrate-binding protein n=1 Tax=Halomonas sp. NyZ770 TaxID=2883106 RepID=UPI00054AD78A|nr:CmpA/NrtA family ABC transporter substrate-binding protein [Halomonas sp. NyZ770]KHJ52033.1 nitrate ABC transporter substrate-binding protein [Halomonas hydrothermalis]UDM06301.1 ABC transporter substrate-binding protein [Halomonas sp. NyZ770]
MKENNDHSSLGNPFDHRQSLIHGRQCDCHQCHPARPSVPSHQATLAGGEAPPSNAEQIMDRVVESALVRGIFGHSDMHRRQFMKLVGGGTAAAALATLLPMESIKAAVKENLGPLEKTELDIGFIPITCATPIIMAHPMGFYERYGLNVNVIKTAGWALIRDNSLNDRYDAAHMLSPMPLAMSLGAGSTQRAFVTPAIENVNGQAIVLHNDHQDKRDPQQWKGFTFGVPFEYSMHNFLLRYYVAEHGLDPDQDIQIRVIPPPEMVANLRAGNIDGFLSPDPFNQRAVFERIGFIHLLTKEIWDGHPCCAFATSARFAQQNPNTYGALLRAIIDATQYSSDPANRSEIAEAIAPTNYLNQPVTVIEQVLTGRFADGLGNVQNVPDRIDFDPFPWQSMAVWILTQMKRWGYIEGSVDYQQIARDVFLASEARTVMNELGYDAPEETSRNYQIMGKTFDYTDPEGYLASFDIRRS